MWRSPKTLASNASCNPLSTWWKPESLSVVTRWRRWRMSARCVHLGLQCVLSSKEFEGALDQKNTTWRIVDGLWGHDLLKNTSRRAVAPSGVRLLRRQRRALCQVGSAHDVTPQTCVLIWEQLLEDSRARGRSVPLEAPCRSAKRRCLQCPGAC